MTSHDDNIIHVKHIKKIDTNLLCSLTHFNPINILQPKQVMSYILSQNLHCLARIEGQQEATNEYNINTGNPSLSCLNRKEHTMKWEA